MVRFLTHFPCAYSSQCFLSLQRAFHSVISARILLHTRHQVAQRRTMKLDSKLVPEILQDLDNTFTNIDEGSRNPATYSMKSPGGSLTEFKLTANWLGKTWRSSKVSSVWVALWHFRRTLNISFHLLGVKGVNYSKFRICSIRANANDRLDLRF